MKICVVLLVIACDAVTMQRPPQEKMGFRQRNFGGNKTQSPAVTERYVESGPNGKNDKSGTVQKPQKEKTDKVKKVDDINSAKVQDSPQTVAIKAAIKAQKEGYQDWVDKLGKALKPYAKKNKKLADVMGAYGWDGEKFRRDPDLERLLQAVQDAPDNQGPLIGGAATG